MKVRIILTCLVMIVSGPLHSQSEYPVDVTFEFQAYPTGLIPGLRIEKFISEKSAISLRFGYNWIRHRDLGEHEDERGDGYGITIGYKHYFNKNYSSWFAGVRSDIWWNTIDWEDPNLSIGGIVSGRTDIVVLQPTIEAGKAFVLSSGLIFSPSVAFGYEWNVKTTGEPTGQGAILLVGIQLGKRF